MELGRARSHPLPPGSNATNAARHVRVRRSRNGLGDLGYVPAAGIPNAREYPAQIPPGGMTRTVMDTYNGTSTVPVPATVYDGYNGIVANPYYVPPNWTRSGQAAARGILPKWKLPTNASKAQFNASAPSGGTKTIFVTGDNYGITPVTYFSSPQYEADYGLWYAVGTKLGFITPVKNDWADYLGLAIGYAVEAAAMIGVAYGGYLVAASVATAAPTASAIMPGAQAAASGATGGLLPTASAIMPGAEAVASGATGGLLTTGGTALTASGVASGLKTVKDVYGVANTIRALMRKPMGGAPLPTLDSSYGNGGFSPPVAQSAPSFFQGNNLLWIGGGIIAVLATVVLMQGKKRGKA